MSTLTLALLAMTYEVCLVVIMVSALGIAATLRKILKELEKRNDVA